MKRFQFHLQTILRLKERKEEEEIRNLSQVVSQWNALQKEKEASLLAIEKTYRRLDQGMVIGNSLDNFLAWEQYIRSENQKVKSLDSKLASQQSLVDAQREKVMQARREKKILEILREKRFSEWKKKKDRQEIREIEEFHLNQASPTPFESSPSQKRVPKVFQIRNREDGGDEFLADFKSLKDYYEKFYQGKGT